MWDQRPLTTSTFSVLGYSETLLHKNPVVRSSKVHDLVTPVQPRSTTIICFRTLAFGNLKFQLKPHYNLPGAHDLFKSVPLQINGSRLFGSSGFECFNLLCACFSQGTLPELDGFSPHVLPNDGWPQMTLGLWDFGTFRNTTLLCIHNAKFYAPSCDQMVVDPFLLRSDG
jgi:hypothetical protein